MPNNKHVRQMRKTFNLRDNLGGIFIINMIYMLTIDLSEQMTPPTQTTAPVLIESPVIDTSQ
ncbi:MAG: hypothetical protein QF535_07865 [Anaerolineales bacterium]|nr:hypothetical protein [Anaerolineales bacterium]